MPVRAVSGLVAPTALYGVDDGTGPLRVTGPTNMLLSLLTPVVDHALIASCKLVLLATAVDDVT